jgi:sortase A
MRMARWRRLAALVPLVIGFTGCGGSAEDETAPVVTSATTTSTDAPRTTTTRPTTTTTTTTAPTTTLELLPVPAPVPAADAVEPVIEMGRVEIPKIGVAMAMFEGVTDATLDLGPGHWPGSALPGELGNVVIGGHRVSNHAVFRYVDQLVPGDEIIISNATGVPSTYVVNAVEVVDPTAIWIIEQQRAYTATLFACHPPGSTKQRIVVHAQLKDAV